MTIQQVTNKKRWWEDFWQTLGLTSVLGTILVFLADSDNLTTVLAFAQNISPNLPWEDIGKVTAASVAALIAAYGSAKVTANRHDKFTHNPKEGNE